MKSSTVDILNETMRFNTNIQEDQLNLQVVCDKLNLKMQKLQLNCSIEKDIKESINDRNAITICNEYASLLSGSDFIESDIKASIEGYSRLQGTKRPSYLKNQLSIENRNAILDTIKELNDMLDASIKDLDNKTSYCTLDHFSTNKAIIYNYHTVDDMTYRLQSILNSICSLGVECLKYDDLKKRFLEDNDLHIALLNVIIGSHDYITMNIPTPTYQSVEKAELSEDGANEISSLVNSIVSSENLNALNTIKNSISERMQQDDKCDTVKSIHFISQVVMAVKNSILTVQNYHHALINELL